MSDFKELAQSVISSFLKDALGEGKRVVQQKTVEFFNHAIGAIRGLLLLQYVLMSTCFLWAISFFASAFIVCQQLDQGAGIAWTMSLKFCAGVAGFTTLLLAITVRKGAWTSAAQVEKRVAQLFGPTAVAPSVSRAELKAIVSEILDEQKKAS